VPLPIEDYALLGDTGTAALVGTDGSVDWLCLPRFDSPACFAALLGDPGNGRWLLGPAEPGSCTRRYLPESTTLETTHTTPTGTLRVIDVMPIGDRRADLVRSVECLSGTVRVRHEWVVRLGYGKVRPWVHRDTIAGYEVIIAVAGPDRLVLRGDRLPVNDDGRHVDEFDLTAGQKLHFATTWSPSHHPPPQPLEIASRIAHTTESMQEWAGHCSYDGPYREAIVRSLLTLRLLTHGGTGGIVAAPTTSLPEDFGGVRNWDYRFCWLRDASMTLGALLRCGYRQEAELWRKWLLRAVAGDPEDIQIMYAVDGSRDLPERTVDHLPGYDRSGPVRVGNAAVDQRQGDVVGEVLFALEQSRAAGLQDSTFSWALQRVLLDHLASTWRHPDNGIWEIRGTPRHFTHSRALAWAAFDSGICAVEDHGLEGDVDRWRAERQAIRSTVLTEGVDRARGTLTQHSETTEVDASLLVLLQLGFLDGDDPLALGTVQAVEEDLMHGGLLRRYRTETGVDGVAGDEHPFLACSFWLVSAYAAVGRVDHARALFERLLTLRNDVGLLAEEVEPVTGRHAGNFPQALSHLALVNAALDLDGAGQPPR